jgi:hypothetical protein
VNFFVFLSFCPSVFLPVYLSVGLSVTGMLGPGMDGKALCLVCLIGGAHGLWLLPALLAVFGGTKDEGQLSNQPVANMRVGWLG